MLHISKVWTTQTAAGSRTRPEVHEAVTPVRRSFNDLRLPIALAGLLLAAFVDRSTATAVSAIARPWIAGELGFSADQATLATVIYDAGYYGGIILAPAAVRYFGLRRTLLTVLAAYALAAVSCAMTADFVTYVVSSGFMGLVEGAFFLCGIVTLATTFTGPGLLIAIILFGLVSLGAVGSALWWASVLANDASWRLIFVLFAALTSLAWLGLKISAPATRGAPFFGESRASDLTMVPLVLGATFAYAYITLYGAEYDWLGDQRIAFALAALVVLVLVIVFWEKAFPEKPLIGVAQLWNRSILSGAVLGLAAGFPVFGVIVLLDYLQGPLGFSPEMAGGAVALRVLTTLLFAPLGPIALLLIKDSRIIVAAGFAIVCSSYAVLATGITDQQTFGSFGFAELILGAGLSLIYAPLVYTTVSNVKPLDGPLAYSTMNLCFVCAGSFANAGLATAYDHRVALHTERFAAQITLSRSAIRLAVEQLHSPHAAAELFNELVSKASAVAAFDDIAIISGVVAFIAIPLTLLMRPAKPIALAKADSSGNAAVQEPQ
jgi:DHA2 family multidrug resistance protein